jgi:hypothetical protein
MCNRVIRFTCAIVTLPLFWCGIYLGWRYVNRYPDRTIAEKACVEYVKEKTENRKKTCIEYDPYPIILEQDLINSERTLNKEMSLAGHRSTDRRPSASSRTVH